MKKKFLMQFKMGILMIFFVCCACSDHPKICDQTINTDEAIYLNGVAHNDVKNSIVEVINNQGMVIDTLKLIPHGYYNGKTDYLFSKKISVDKLHLKINFTGSNKNLEPLIITDIAIESVRYKNMTGYTDMCRIKNWKINGEKYSIDWGDKFINSK